MTPGAAGPRPLLAALAAIGLAAGAGAMDPDRATSQYVRDRWGTERGFPGGQVHAIAQTADGTLWVGSEKGLVQFDGLSFRLVATSGPTARRSGPVLGLTADAEGALWVLLPGPNVLRYRGGDLEPALPPLEPREDAVTAICRGTDGALILSGLVHGLLRLHQGQLAPLAPTSALPRSPVIAMAQAADGKVWIGTRDAGLFHVEGGRVTAVTKGLPDTKVNCVLPLDGHVWIGTGGGIVRWNGAELTAAGVPSALGRVQALAMARDRDRNLWIGTGAGLVRIDAQGVSSFHHEAGESPSPVTALFEDREGNLWTGGAAVLERLRDSRFTTYGRAEGLPSERNGPVYADPAGRTWFAPAEGGLFWLRGGRVERVRESGLDADVVYSIAASRDGLWVGRQRGGLTHLRFDGDSLSARTWRAADGLAQDSVYAVHESRDGTVWAATLSAGVSQLRNGRFTTYTSAHDLPSNSVSSIVDGADGTTWFGTPNGLGALASDGWKVYTARDGLPSDDVNCLLEDSEGVLWIGTGDGLAFLAAGRVQSPRGSPASLRKAIFGLAEDRGGSLWMATSDGVLRVKRDGLVQGGLTDADVSDYGLADGLHSVAGTKRQRSAVADARGRIWLSMERGLSMVDPAHLAGASAPAIARVLSVSADGSPLDLRAPVRVPPGRQRITFGFAGLSLAVPERVRFRYRLDGFDHGWSEPAATREAAYTNLGPGSYRFRVTASNSDGLWNGEEAALALEIAPAAWQTWWFRLAAALAGALAILGVYRLRLRHLTRQLHLRFEERLAERTRIAQELHDTLLQGFLSASMQLHVAFDQVPADSPEKPRLGRVLDLMRRVIEEGREAVQGLRSPDHDADDLAAAFSRVRQELGIQGEAGLKVISEGPARPLHPVIRDEVYRIGREALVNAFRHSRAKSIEVEVERGPGHLRVLVRDDGCGIDPGVLRAGRPGHWGLPGMRERSERIGARLRVGSREGMGTEVELSVPGHLAFRDPLSGGPLRRLWRRFRERKAMPETKAPSEKPDK